MNRTVYTVKVVMDGIQHEIKQVCDYPTKEDFENKVYSKDKVISIINNMIGDYKQENNIIYAVSDNDIEYKIGFI